MAPNKPHDLATRAQALTMLQLGQTLGKIHSSTKLAKSTITRIEKIAKERGYNPEKDPTILEVYV
jgi:uncharacterized protein YerC